MASFTAAGQTTPALTVGPYDTFQWVLSVAGGDSMTATITLQRSERSSGGWEALATATTVGTRTHVNQTGKTYFYRLYATAHSGDAVVYANSISDDKFDSLSFRDSEIRDSEGRTAVSLRDGEVTFPNDVVVSGSLTVSGLNLSTASEDAASVAGAATYTPSWTAPTHSIVTMTGSTCTIANNSGTPTGAMPWWLTIINSSGGAVDLQSDVTFGAAYTVDARGHILANGESTTMAFFWDDTNSACRQVESQPDSIDVDGAITTSAGDIDATAGAVSAGTTVTAGTGITATTGNIAASSGDVTASAAVSAGTTVTAGTGITATTGNIAASSGNLSASGTVTGGTGVIATTGGVTATAGGVTVTAGGLTINGGDLTCNGASITRSSSLISTSGNITTTGTGAITAANGLTATAGGLTVTAGGATITAGNLGVSSGTITASGNISTSGGKFTGQIGDALTYVNRGTTGWDYTIATLNETSTGWLDLDISGIVGTAKRYVQFRLYGEGSTTEEVLGIRENGGSSFTSYIMYTQAANVGIDKVFVCPTDSSGVVEYRGDTNVTVFNLAIIGWWREA